MSLLSTLVSTALGMAGLGQFASAAEQAIGALPELEAAASTPEARAALTQLENVFAKLAVAIEGQMQVTESRIAAIRHVGDLLKVQTTWTPEETQNWMDKASGTNAT